MSKDALDQGDEHHVVALAQVQGYSANSYECTEYGSPNGPRGQVSLPW